MFNALGDEMHLRSRRGAMAKIAAIRLACDP
jgi:hypothetical protein